MAGTRSSLSCLNHLTKCWQFFSATLEQLHHSPSSNRRATFEQHIEPAYKKLEAVHKDYEKTFHELIQRLSKGIKSRQIPEFVPELLIWLTDKSFTYRTEREYLKNIDIELEIIAKNIAQNPDIAALGNQEISEAIIEFADETIAYFDFTRDFGLPSTGKSGRRRYITNSAYSHMSVVMKEILKEQNNEANIDRLVEVRSMLEEWVNTALHFYWRQITRSYLKLRGLCLS